MVGRTVGNYKLLEKLGEGGMGAVYKGVDLMVEREVAIKMLRPEIARQPEVVERFRVEAVMLARLNHPNIATLYSFFREGGEYFMVMEFVMGRTLESVLRNCAPMPVEQAIATSLQVLDAIEHAHAYGILHRDIKPANIMLTGSGQVKVTDFGIARVLGTARMTREGCMYGTLEYLAPERIRGQEADIRSDLYSMGVVLYEMLSGRLPFTRESEYELMRAHLEETPPSFASLGLSSISRELEIVVEKALAKFPEERFGSAGEFRSALAGAEGERPSQPASASQPSRMVARIPAAVQAPAMLADPDSSVVSVVPIKRPPWKIYAVVASVLVLIGLMLALPWIRKHMMADPTKPAPAPVVTQSAAPAPVVSQPTPVVQPQAGIQLGAAPASSPQNVSVVQGQVAVSPTTKAGKAKSPVKGTPDLERRKAALKALEKGETATPNATKKEKGQDRRSSSLEALQK